MPTLAEISSQPTNDPNVRAYHTRFEMSSGPEGGVRGDGGNLGAFGQLMLEIKGVVGVNVAPYVLLITKAQLFTWDEITPLVERHLKQFVVSQRQLIQCLEDHVKDQANDGPGDRKQISSSPLRSVRGKT